MVNNILQSAIFPEGDDEIFETLLSTKGMKIERIISSGQITPSGKWYDQETDEWVLLMQGEATLEYHNGEIYHLKKGDYMHIPARQKHRVTYTSKSPHCIWLAIHYGSNTEQ